MIEWNKMHLMQLENLFLIILYGVKLMYDKGWEKILSPNCKKVNIKFLIDQIFEKKRWMLNEKLMINYIRTDNGYKKCKILQ